MKKLEIIKEAIELNKHLHQMSNQKSGVVLVVASLVFTGITGVPDAIKNQMLYQWGFMIMLISLIIAIVLIIGSVYPRYGKRNPNNLLYFVDIVEMVNESEPQNKGAKYLELLTEINSDEQIEELYAIEAVSFSEMLAKEYKWQKAAFRVLLLFVPGIVCIVIAFFRGV